MDWFLYGRNARHERVNVFVGIAKDVFRTLSNIYDVDSATDAFPKHRNK